MKWIDYDEQEPELAGQRLVVKVRMVDFMVNAEDGGPVEKDIDVLFAHSVQDDYGVHIEVDEDQEYEHYPIITDWSYLDK
jgi:hypothetical protein